MTNNELSRRRFLQMSAMASSVALLAACGGTTTPPPAPTAAPGADAAPTAGADAAPTAVPAAAPAADGATKLSVLWENWGDIYNNLMTEIGTDFTKTNPALALEWNFDPDWVAKLTTLIAAKTLPDVTIMRSAQVTTMASKGALMPLDDIVQSAGLKREDFVTPLWDSGQYKGKLYALPGGADYWCMYYSKDVYRDAGLDPEKPATTFDELLTHSKAILKKDAGGEIQRLGYNPSAGHLQNWSFIFGGQFYDAASGKITANDPIIVSVLEKLASYVKELDINKLAAFNTRPGAYEAGNPFSTKQAAYLFDGFWTYEALDQHAPDIDYAVAYWPTVKGTEDERKNYMIGGWQVSLPAGTAHNSDAAKFIRYAFIDKSAEMGYKTLNGTCVQSQFQAWEEGVKAKLGTSNRMSPHLNKFAVTGAAGKNYFPAIPVQNFYQDELSRAYDLVVRGERKPQEMLDEVTKNVQTELDKTMKG